MLPKDSVTGRSRGMMLISRGRTPPLLLRMSGPLGQRMLRLHDTCIKQLPQLKHACRPPTASEAGASAGGGEEEKTVAEAASSSGTASSSDALGCHGTESELLSRLVRLVLAGLQEADFTALAVPDDEGLHERAGVLLAQLETTPLFPDVLATVVASGVELADTPQLPHLICLTLLVLREQLAGLVEDCVSRLLPARMAAKLSLGELTELSEEVGALRFQLKQVHAMETPCPCEVASCGS
eukprot:PLAT12247.1.p2 GENE.PLAT12247.1~~PLAT12247.1.p2  ORF type:complete len:240 (-),score=98.62 PLAT12247.1:82-801(-)